MTLSKLTLQEANSLTDPDDIRKAIKAKNVGIRCALAWNENTPIDALEKLLDDESSNVRVNALECGRLPIAKIFEYIDEYLVAQRVVSQSSEATAVMLEALYEVTEDKGIWRKILNNPNASDSLVQKIQEEFD